MIFREHITSAMAESEPESLFLFGDNELRAGMGGQAKELRDAVNAIGVRTKRRPSMDEDAFWTDAEFDRCRAMIDEDLKWPFVLARTFGTPIICPKAGIGTGRAQLPQRAPRIWAYLRGMLVELHGIQFSG